MRSKLFKNIYIKANFGPFLLSAIVLCSGVLVPYGIPNSYGQEIYSKSDSPFGKSLDDWMNKWWRWWISTTTDDVPPNNGAKYGACLANKTGSMVMLMETAVAGKPHDSCDISSTQGLIVPLWTAFLEDSKSKDGKQLFKGYSYEQLSKQARMGDLGAVTSVVKLDGVPVADLNVVSSDRGGTLDYKITSMNNVSELYSKGFNLTIPENTWRPDQNPGTWRSGAHGWFVFLKPLPPGNHNLEYNVGVTGTGPNDHSAEISYAFKVK